ncbi:MAG: glycoside hydrolase family 30 protein [Chitinivibrionales bacterium]|nr:glycoside hydrolase family 30 protein [Chitinivibrionales bacterium]
MKTLIIYSTNPQNSWKVKKRGFVASSGAEPDLQITDKKYQSIDGFGGCFNEIGWAALGALNPERRGRVLKDLFDGNTGCKFNFCRIPIGASDYALQWYSHNENDNDFAMKKFSIEHDRKYLLPYIKAAIKTGHDLKFFASPWSPPTWMKNPKAYNFGTFIMEKKYLQAYARYFLKFVRAYAQEGIKIGQIHPQNEPVADQKFPSCVWTGAKMRDLIGGHLGPLFKKEKLDCQIWLGTINSDKYDEWANVVLSDAKAKSFITGVGYQWAGKGAIARTHESWPATKLIQTENECGDGANTWEYAHYVFSLMRHYFTNGAGGYVYWNMVLPLGGESTWGWKQNSMVTIDIANKKVIYNPEFYLMKHLSAFVKRDARRIGLAGSSAGNSIGFLNPDNEVIIVTENPFKTDKKLALKFQQSTYSVILPPYSFNTLVLRPHH